MSMVVDDRAMQVAFKATLVEFAALARAQTKAMAERAAASMRRYVHVESGKTRAAIGVRDGPDYFAVGIVDKSGLADPNVPFYEEFGTTEMRPRPFGRPAIHEVR